MGLVAIMLVASVVTGCGGGASETKTVTLGWLADQTGSSADAWKEVMYGMNDFMAEMEPIPGVEVRILTYDTRLEYGRYIPGYEWLIAQGTDMLLGYSPDTPRVTQTRQAEDKVPMYALVAYSTTMDADWCYAYNPTNELEGRAIMDYVINTWWEAKGAGRPVKVGAVGNSQRSTTDEVRKGFQHVLDQNPGKAEYRTTSGELSQSAWASEYASVKDCDVLVMSTVGPSTGHFLKEAYSRGYTGQVVASSISLLSIWDLVVSLVQKADLDGIIIPHYYPAWTDDSAYTQKLEAALAKYRGDKAAKLKEGTTWISGWVEAEVLIAAVRQAAKDVGAENINGEALRDALDTMELEIPGMPTITMADRGTHHVFQPYYRMMKFDAAADEWSATTDWTMTPGFAS